MVKGVNKTIIEINETGNAFFDRVVLFVSPSKASADHQQLKKEAMNYINTLAPDFDTRLLRGRIRKKKILKKRIILISALTLAAAIIVFSVLNIL